MMITELVKESIADGMAIEDIAVITPFRRQVLCVREHLKNAIQGDIPLIDTVERLQGQDVDMIIISCTTTNEEYYLKNVAFLENPNRWNVMISRAKKKVIIIGKHLGFLQSSIL
jgi:DNA replication ATP-dependent helicase Dna2